MQGQGIEGGWNSQLHESSEIPPQREIIWNSVNWVLWWYGCALKSQTWALPVALHLDNFSSYESFFFFLKSLSCAKALKLCLASQGMKYASHVCVGEYCMQSALTERSRHTISVYWLGPVCACVRKLLSHVQLFVTPWTKQSMEFSRPEYWSGPEKDRKRITQNFQEELGNQVSSGYKQRSLLTKV